MEYANRVYMPSGQVPEINEAPNLLCLPGKVAIAMLPKNAAFGSVALPDTVQGRLRADAGYVCSVGAPVMLQSGELGRECHLKRGDMVAVRPYAGLWDDDTFPGFEMRIYGGAHSNGVYQPVPWWDDIVLYQKGGEWLPTGDNLLVKRKRNENPLVQLESWLDQGTVIAAGPYADQGVVGLEVAWKAPRWDDVLTLDGDGYDDSVVLVPGYLSMLAKVPSC